MAFRNDYQAIEIESGVQRMQSKVSSLSIVAALAGAIVVMFGLTHMSGATGSLYSGVQVARPNTATRLTNPGQRPSAVEPVQYATPEVADHAATMPDTVPSVYGYAQQGMVAILGAAIGAIGAFAVQKFTSKKPQTCNWSMAAIADDDEFMATSDDLLLARQEFLRLQGKGPGAKLAPGEILRPVNFPGYDQPVDLVEMYKRFEELLGDNVRTPTLGNIVTGTVFHVDDNGASVDFGGKAFGFCPLEELALCKVRKANEVLEVGDVREFKIIAPATQRRKDDEEFTLLSLKTLAEQIAWKRLQQYRENDVSFSAVLKGKNRGGYTIEVLDLAVPGFLPKSQATSDLATAPENAEPETFMEQVVEVKVLDLDPERQRLVVSQRAANPKMATDTFKIGTVHEGVVQNVKPYGIFVDVNGMSGLLHISQISHSRIENVESIFKVGDKIKCMVLSQDQVQGRLALSTKRLEPTHGDMLVNPQLVYDSAEEMAGRFREDIAAAEKRMQEFEARLAEQNTVAFGAATPAPDAQ